MPNAAVPRERPEPEPAPARRYEVTSDRCVWGKRGEVIELSLDEGQELSLLQAGTVKRAATEKVERSSASEDRPSAAVELKGN